MPASPATHLHDLPLQIVTLSLSYQALIKRLQSRTGLRTEIAVGMGSIFLELCENEGCIMKDLSTRLQMPKGTLSGLVTRMEKLGLVKRLACPDDGRAFRVILTRKARAMETKLRTRHERTIDILQAGLSGREVAELKRLLGRVLVNLRDNEIGVTSLDSFVRPARRTLGRAAA